MILCRVDGVRLVVCKSMVASFPLQDQSQFHNLTSTPVSRVADPLLATLHWAGQSTDTHGLGMCYKYLIFAASNFNYFILLASFNFGCFLI